MNASKSARHQQSIINRPTCGGGSGKAGLAPRIGWQSQSNPLMRRGINTQFGLICTPSTTIQTQNYGYRATHTGRMG